MLRQVTAIRYVTPLREGGSLPGVVEADDEGTYVVKFRGAGQGPKALVAEVISGELARRLELPVPDLTEIHLDPIVARAEPDEEVQELIKASAGSNLGMDFLPGALGYDPVAHPVDSALASRVIAFDAFVENVDRSWRNPNLLIWHRELWLIDHGAALYFHHSWQAGLDPERFAGQRYDSTEHVFAAYAGQLPEVDAELAGAIDETLLAEILQLVPDEWLEPAGRLTEPAGIRQAYLDYLLARLANRGGWLPVPTGGQA